MDELTLFLQKKKIDPVQFKLAEPERYAEFAGLFEELSEASFVMQKLFLFNRLRRKYPYTVPPVTPRSEDGESQETPDTKSPVAKPVVKRAVVRKAPPPNPEN
jgi:hypothetical protein